MTPGERWAYRTSRQSKRWHEVTVVTVGKKKVRVEYVGDAYEGERKWVNPSRLEVPWQELKTHREKDRARQRYRAACQASQPESWAYLTVLGEMPAALIEVGTPAKATPPSTTSTD